MTESRQSAGVPASPSGHSRAEPEEVSALRASVPNAVAIARQLRREERKWLLATPRQFPLEAVAISMRAGWKYGGGAYASFVKRYPLLFTRMRDERSPSFAYRLTTLGCEVASAIEARRAETHSGSVADESAVAKPDAPVQP